MKNYKYAFFSHKDIQLANILKTKNAANLGYVVSDLLLQKTRLVHIVTSGIV